MRFYRTTFAPDIRRELAWKPMERYGPVELSSMAVQELNDIIWFINRVRADSYFQNFPSVTVTS